MVWRCEEGKGGEAYLRDTVVHVWVLSLTHGCCCLVYEGWRWRLNGRGVFEHGWGL